MIITAKFPGICPTCNKQIMTGEKVEWSKGERARHATCVEDRPAVLRQRPIGKCRAPGCTAQAMDRGYCRRCAFDEFDDC